MADPTTTRVHLVNLCGMALAVIVLSLSALVSPHAAGVIFGGAVTLAIWSISERIKIDV